MPAPETERVVLGLWRALSERDWDAVTTFLADDCVYVDMPLGPALAARGPDDIVKRLKVGLEPLAGVREPRRPAVSDGTDVMYEHSETWTWASGETVCAAVRHRAPRRATARSRCGRTTGTSPV